MEKVRGGIGRGNDGRCNTGNAGIPNVGNRSIAAAYRGSFRSPYTHSEIVLYPDALAVFSWI
jgi:hypothetical protein